MTENEMFEKLKKLLPNPDRNELLKEHKVSPRTGEISYRYKLTKKLFINGNDTYVTPKIISEQLLKLGISFQVFYDYVVLELNSTEERPTCPICGEVKRFKSSPYGYSYTCGKENCMYLFYHYYSKGRELLTNSLGNKSEEEIFSWTLEMFKNSGSVLLTKVDLIQDNYIIIPKWLISTNKLLNKTRYPSAFGEKVLNYLGTTTQILYDVCVLGITSLKSRPKCAICGNDAMFLTITEGYKSACSSEHGKLLSIQKLVTNVKSKRKSKSGCYESQILKNKFKYDSSWEKDFIIFMERLYQKGYINSFSRNRDFISYIKPTDNTEHKYLPDFEFFTNEGVRVVVEIKPAGLLRKDEVVIRKKFAAQKFYWKQKVKYITLTENELYKNIHGSFWIYDYIV